MPTPRDDHELLRAYVERGDHAAFAELVARHADMVYGAASRQVGRSAGLAEDVTQAAFILLARKASSIAGRIVVAAWLHKATRYCALNAMKIEQRRRNHERKAGEQLAARRALAGGHADINWAQGAALLDEGIARLGLKDREAVVLRFLERRSFADVGDALGVSEEAAQMRVSRAVDKLRDFFRRNGLAISATTLRANVNANAVVPAPSALKMALAPVAIHAASPAGTVTGSATIGIADRATQLADEGSRAMDWARVWSTSKFAAAGIGAAAAVVLAFLLLRSALGDPTSAPTPARPLLPDTRAVISDEHRPLVRLEKPDADQSNLRPSADVMDFSRSA